ncbi:PGPGW domain-containing protein [Nocardiopsis salina]|uniref:PGPGW domain-containing protein n=1 Tax=Nocardiopsis salina TaxID=245836 RepID=UPI00034A6766|nr:PGPGW domain-containing protein [Nocardiopsis salina]
MHSHPALRLPWRILVGTVGTVVLLTGVVFFVTPGPGIAALLLGLLILSTEFRWAHRILRPARKWARRAEKYAERRKHEYVRRRRARRATREGRQPDNDTDPDPDPV